MFLDKVKNLQIGGDVSDTICACGFFSYEIVQALVMQQGAFKEKNILAIKGSFWSTTI